MKLPKYPRWMDRPFQGITYWMGHRRSLYRNYPLAEGALVAEACNLIYANLPEHLTLHCEVMYTELLKRHTLPDPLRERARADLVVATSDTSKPGEIEPRYIIEVKRGSAPASQINSDLRRLAAVRREHPKIRTFLLVISEAKRPKRFVHAAGASKLGIHDVPNDEGYFRVRRTWKAAHAFQRRDAAQYACLLEVFGKKKAA